MERGLAQLEPEGLDTEGQGWQQRKSIQTRIAILEAAIDCLEKRGYARTTTQMIAQTAQISRGAMLHHYATKQDLVEAVIDYTFYKRMEQFVARIHELSDDARIREQAGIELYWQSLLTREYAAYLELSVAARTDDELRGIFVPKARRFVRVERETVLQAFPEWADQPAIYELAMDFCIASMEGLLLNRDVWDDRDRRALLRNFISQTILALRDGQLAAPTRARESG
ncbi:MAG: helix-turn-helix domain-containing protein [Caulobacteraceae bacterium]